MDLAFAPDGGYFLIHPKGHKWRGVPHVLSNRFKSDAPDKVAKIHCLSFGEGGALFMSWTSTNGKVYSWSNFKGQYPSLKAWLENKDKGHKKQNLYVVLGPNGSFYALSRGVGSYRHSLVPALVEKLDSLKGDGKKVRSLQLGVDGSYFLEDSTGSRSWNFKGNYSSLQEYVKEHTSTNVATVNLSPFSGLHYFVTFKNSHAKWNLPATWAPDIREVAKQYQHQNASSSGGTADSSSSGHNASRPHKHRASSSAASVMADVEDGLEMTEKIVKTAGVVISTAGMVAGAGCSVM